MIGETPRATAGDDASMASQPASTHVAGDAVAVEETPKTRVPREIGGRDGPEPTRFGDWEKNGRCIDF
jgi:hypothetical protein